MYLNWLKFFKMRKNMKRGHFLSFDIVMGKYFHKFWKRKYVRDFEFALIGYGQFEISSEVLALCTYNVPKNGKFKLSFTQPLTMNEGKILPLERAGK